MAKVPTTDNQAVKKSEGVVDFVYRKLGVNLAVAAACVSVPFLASPLIKPLVSFVIDKVLGDYLGGMAKKEAANAVIDSQIEGEKHRHKEAETRLEAIEKTGDKDAIDKATEEFESALGDLLGYDGD